MVDQPAEQSGRATRARRPAQARALIAIPARFSVSASALRHNAEVAAAALVRAVYQAGGEPMIVHPAPPPAGDEPGPAEDEWDEKRWDDEARARLWWADGVLLPGGGDLSARWSGQPAHESLYDVDETQDAFDLAVARVALADRIPLLAICRGNQVVNVARGGDLVQDLAETLGADHRHKRHTVEVDPGSPLREYVSSTRMEISCYHHQGIGRLGEGLRAGAHADDGTVEAITLDGHDGWFLGVQWHPEDTAAADPQQAELFRALVLAAEAGR